MFIILLGIGGLITSATADCIANSGPAGGTECVAFPIYNHTYQWATCLTDAYIYEKSEGKHHCRNRNSLYCYYQCMCELHNECDGPSVNSTCSCDPDSPGLTSASPQSTLAPWCFSPSGQQCSWYRDCLEERYPCEGTGAGYDITYAKTFCDLYSDNSDRFSEDGQLWIDAVRKCLQVELVPILRPWIKASCSDIKHMAFASHTKCYASLTSGIPFCSLGPVERMKIFWTIKGAFNNAFWETMDGLWDLIKECSGRILKEFKKNTFEVLHIVVKKIQKTGHDLNDFRGKIVDRIAEKLNWGGKGLDWYVPAIGDDGERKKREVEQTTLNPDRSSRLDIFMVSKREYDLNAPTAPVVNVNQEATSLADSVRNGLGPLTVDGVPVTVLSMAACSDVSCNSTYLEVNAPVGTASVTRATFWSLSLVFVGVLLCK